MSKWKISDWEPTNPRRNTLRIFDSWRSGDKADTCIHFCIRFPRFLQKSGDRAETSIRFKNPYPQSSSQPAGKSGAMIKRRQRVISRRVKFLPFPERVYWKTPSLRLRLRVPSWSRREEIKRKYFSCLFPVYFLFVSTLFPLAAICRVEEEIEWKYVSASTASIFNEALMMARPLAQAATPIF